MFFDSFIHELKIFCFFFSAKLMVISLSGHHGARVTRVVDWELNFVNDGVQTLHRQLVVEIVLVKVWKHKNVMIFLV